MHFGLRTQPDSLYAPRMWSPENEYAAPRPAPGKQTLLFEVICRIIIGNLLIGTGFAQSGASYTAQRRVGNIVVDGNLNDAVACLVLRDEDIDPVTVVVLQHVHILAENEEALRGVGMLEIQP